MNLDKIRNMPTSLERKDVYKSDCSGWHESLLRSYHIVQFIKCYLLVNTTIMDTRFLLDLIGFLEEAGGGG